MRGVIRRMTGQSSRTRASFSKHQKGLQKDCTRRRKRSHDSHVLGRVADEWLFPAMPTHPSLLSGGWVAVRLSSRHHRKRSGDGYLDCTGSRMPLAPRLLAVAAPALQNVQEMWGLAFSNDTNLLGSPAAAGRRAFVNYLNEAGLACNGSKTNICVPKRNWRATSVDKVGRHASLNLSRATKEQTLTCRALVLRQARCQRVNGNYAVFERSQT